MEPLYLEDCPQIPVNNKGWYLQGSSKAGDRTGFLLYPMKFLFDCGIRTNLNCENVFMTHVHTDHSLELPSICHKLKGLQAKFQVHVPSSSVRHLELFMRCVSQLSFPDSEDHSDEQIINRAKILFKGVNAGESFLVSNQQYEILILPAHHTVQAVGYGISNRRKKLKEEYVQMMADPSIEKRQRIQRLEELKSNPLIDLYEIVTTPELAFFCDSNIHNLLDHEEWQRYPCIVCECTGLSFTNTESRSEEEFLHRGHTCLTQLLPVMRRHKDKRWILIHVSAGVRKDEIMQIQLQLREEEGLDVFISCS